ncbi:MAG: T9SS type A sorting domain-containing protein [Bacteroidia bacterium]
MMFQQLRKIIILLGVQLCFLNAHSQKLNWVQTFGGKGYDIGRNISHDPFGNILLMGTFTDTCNFGPTTQLVSKGLTDVYISKFNSSGQLIWTYSYGNQLNNTAQALTCDADGNIYVTGHFQGEIDFNPAVGLDTLSAWLQSTAYVLKINANGNFAWVKRIGGYYENNTGPNGAIAESNMIEYDHNGALIVGGRFEGIVDFNFSSNKDSIIQGMGNFILKIDLDGQFNWVRIIRNLDYNEPFTALKTYQNGDIISAGVYARTVDFDLGPDTFYMYVSNFQFFNFVLKLKSNGDFVWVKSIPQKGYLTINSINLEQEKKIVIAGNFSDSLEFTSGSSPIAHSTKNLSNGFLGVFTDSFQHLQSYSIQSDRNNFALSSHTDLKGNLYLSGFTLGKIWINQINQTDTLLPEVNRSIFLLKFDSNAQVVWAKLLPGEGNLNQSLYINLTSYHRGPEQMYYTGFFRDSSDFILQKSGKKTSKGGLDIILVKLQFCDIILSESQNKNSFDRMDTALFSCMSNSTGSSYQWQELRNGQFINIQNDTFFVGAFSPNLKIQSIKLKDHGRKFRCMVWSDSCSLTSRQFNISVNCPELLDTILYLKEDHLDSNVYLIAKTKHNLQSQMEWQILENGEFIGINDSLGIIGKHADTLVLQSSKLYNDSMVFRLRLQLESCIEYSKPILHIVNCQSLTGKVDSIVHYQFLDTVQLIVQSEQAKIYQWEYLINGSYKNIPLNNTQFSGSKNDTLIIYSADGLMMERDFRCLMQNGICSVYSPVSKTRLVSSNSLDEMKEQELVEIYPNPVQHLLNFNSSQNLEGLSYVIYNSTGQVAQIGQISSGNQLELNNLSRGMYLIRMSRLKSKAFKFMIE